MGHEFNGSKYEKASAHQKEWGLRLIEELGLHGHEQVLDLGCGDGTLTAHIAQLLPEGSVTGIDASKGMIATARPKSTDNLHFFLMDIDDLDFDRQFDVVFSNAALHWVKNHERLLENVRRILTDGGRARFNFAGDGNCSHFFSVITDAMDRDEFAPFVEGFIWPWYMPTVDAYNELAQTAAFTTAEVWGENADRYFADKEHMIRWVDQPSLVPFLAILPQKQRAPFREYVITRMIEQTTQQDGRCFETFRRINLLATK